jgi:hypothetical protein
MEKKSENIPLLIFGSFVWGSVVAVTVISPSDKDLSRFYDIANFVTGGVVGVISKEKLETFINNSSPKKVTKRMAWMEIPDSKIEKIEDNYEQY